MWRRFEFGRCNYVLPGVGQFGLTLQFSGGVCGRQWCITVRQAGGTNRQLQTREVSDKLSLLTSSGSGANGRQDPPNSVCCNMPSL
jgi:hypothetical protein